MELKTNSKKFLNPEELLRSIPLAPGMSVADFGCGNGYYSIASAVMVGSHGQVYAFDILEDALSQTATLAKLIKVHNVTTAQCNLEQLGATKLPSTSCDAVILGSLLHQVEKQDNVIREAYRILKTGGKLLAVEWKQDASFGPDQSSRLAKETVTDLIERFGFRPAQEPHAGSYHYALIYQK